MKIHTFKKFFSRILITTIIIFITNCSFLLDSAALDSAKNKAHKIQLMIDKEMFNDIYAEFPPNISNKLPPEQFNKLLSNIHRELGNHKNIKFRTWQYKAGTYNDTSMIILYYDVEFNNGNGSEIFNFTRNGNDDVVFSGYDINSIKLNARRSRKPDSLLNIKQMD